MNLSLLQSSLAVMLLPLTLFENSIIATGEIAGTCSLYLAPSSIKDPNAGWGVFAGKDYDIGDNLGEPGIVVPVIDPIILTYDEGTDNERDAIDILGAYTFGAKAMGGDTEALRVDMLTAGLGTLTNFHPSLFNILPGGVLEDPLLDRAKDHGAGAFTAYHNYSYKAKQKINAGDELFTTTSGDWFSIRNIPTKETYQKVDKLSQALTKMKNQNDKFTENQFLHMLYTLKNNVFPKLKKKDILMKLLPKDPDEALAISEVGSAKLNLENRNLSWLRANGACLDNIREGVSTIPQAGRGAFARRFIPKGTLVSPAPLLHIQHEEYFGVEHPKEEEKRKDGNAFQLLLNYCFGHDESTWLFCPTTSVMLINHNHEKANAEIRWGADSPSSSLTYRTEPKDDLADQTTIQLSFDFIATEDIQAGEEIFIDYGIEWENAWKEHVSLWRGGTEKKTEEYKPASVMNSTHVKISTNPEEYPHHSLICKRDPFSSDEIPNLPIIEEYSGLGDSEEARNLQKLYGDNQYRWWWPCKVNDMGTDLEKYNVTIYQKAPKSASDQVLLTILNFPRNQIRFVDRKYSSDMHLAKAFRHKIMIPDEIYPLHWRDSYKPPKEIVKEWNEPIIHPRSNITDEEYEKELSDAKCGLYIAPSSIEGAGNGVYTAVDLPKIKMPIGPKLPVNIVYNALDEKQPWANYEWSVENFLTMFDSPKEMKASVLAAGLGMMCNFHPGLVNAAGPYPVSQATLDKYNDPGAGAFSDYHSFAFENEEPLDAGDEIFISYGESWLTNRDYLNHVPLEKHYEMVDHIMASILLLLEIEGTQSALEALLVLIKDEFGLDKRVKTLLSQFNFRHDVKNVASNKGTAYATSTHRSLEWLEKNGSCIDHIYVKDSTINQAGKGGFARRQIKNNETIIPVKMLHVVEGRSVLRRRSNVKLQDASPGILADKQVFYNYMYSHPKSSLFFMPVNAGIVINHSSARKNNGKLPNARLAWSQTDKKTKYFLNKAPEDLLKEGYASITVDLIATRDISVDEEIFIDYGVDWEEAWTKHVDRWVPPLPTGGHGPNGEKLAISSKEIYKMNQNKFDKKNWNWSNDHFTICEENDTVEWTEVVLNKKSMNKYNISENHPGFEYVGLTYYYSPCLIQSYSEENETFHVFYLGYEVADSAYSKIFIVEDLPAESLTFIARPLRADHHRNDGHRFSHEINIPDDIFPETWKDL